MTYSIQNGCHFPNRIRERGEKMADLKKCPFCGGEAKVAHDDTIVYTWSYIFCTKCKARTTDFRMSTEYSSDQRAIETWNRRVEDETD